MAYCPNPECPHRLRTGKPAEFRMDVDRCADCGSELTGDDPVQPEPPVPCPPALKRRLIFTLAVVASIWLGFLVPPLHIDTGALAELLGEGAPSAATFAGPFALGIYPFMSAFMLVELFALVVPRLRRRRRVDPALRQKLHTASFVTGALLGIVQGLGIALYLEGLNWSYGFSGPEVVADPGWAFRLKIMLTLTAGSCLYAAAAQLVNRFGVGSGFAVVVLAFWAEGLVQSGVEAWHCLAVELIAPLDLLLGLLALGGIYTGVWWFLRLSDRRHREPHGLPLRLPTCGTLPIELALFFLLLPSTLSNFFALTPWLDDLVVWLAPNTPAYLTLQLGMIAVFVPLASKWFYWRRRRELATGDHRHAWYRAQFHSGLFLLALVVSWYGLFTLLPRVAWMFPVTLVAVPAMAMLIDLWHEIRARWSAPGGLDLVPLEMHQDVPDSIEARRALPRERAAYLQGIHFRSLTYFFGPFVPLVILGVHPEADQD